MTSPLPCPCDTGKPYERCCGRFHGGRPAPTAVALMRSRYSAFALGLGDYLLETWHPTTRPPSLDLDATTRWTGLTIEGTEAGQAWDTTGVVQFAAAWSTPEGDGVLRERSRFTLVDGRWYYVDGV
ncbi:YchJ family protein [Tessaracoccus lubricantis]|uniref:UPF0225 protein GCM10025789_14980 n=1 Tax=Tessaracoccus lubricantis TaxID=545543 RepID=A0ABP9FB62_9ACTN